MTDDDISTDRKYRAPALEKGLDVLELLASHGTAMTPSQISLALGRSLSELFRMIQVLEFKGYISPSLSGDGYELTNKLFTLGMSRAPVKSLVEAALPRMRELAVLINQSCHLAMPSEDQIVIVARVEGPGYYGYSVRTGHRRKIIEATSGRVLYAFQPPEVKAVWDKFIFEGFDEERRKIFLEGAAQVKERGYRHADSDLALGVTDVSAPVIVGNAAVAALTVPYMRQGRAKTVEETIRCVLDSAKQISLEMQSAL